MQSFSRHGFTSSFLSLPFTVHSTNCTYLKTRSLCQHKPHLNPVQIRRSGPHDCRIGSIVPGLDALELLHSVHDHDAAFRVDEDMSRTDAGPATKRHELSQRPSGLPALRAEVFGVGAPVVRVAVHQVPVAVHDVAFLDVDGQAAAGAAADGQRGVVEGDADGLQGDGVDAVGWCGGKGRDGVSLVSKGTMIWS
jgi:hypothetical protein